MKSILLCILITQTLLYSQSEPLQKVKLQLQWQYQFQFAGFLIAKELGYYKDVGLDVEIIEYNNTNIIQDLEDGKVDYALTNSHISYKNKTLRDVTLVATYFQKSPLILITQEDIKSVLALKNKKIMMSQDNITNSSLGILFEYFEINRQNNTFISPSFNINHFIEKKVDVITAFRSNETYTLDKKNIPYNIIDPIEYGFSTSANNLFVAHRKIDHKAQEIEKFLHATKKGWKYALNNIEAVASLIHTKYESKKSLAHLIYEGEVTKKLMLTNLYDIGEINENFILKSYNALIKANYLNETQKSGKLFLKEDDLRTWIQKQYTQRTEYTFAILLSGFFFILLSIILLWSFKMQREIKKRKLVEKDLKHLAEHDSLTGLPNRVLFLERLSQAIKKASNNKTYIAVVYIDLDKFKTVNDSLGHDIGNLLLISIAEKFLKLVHNKDTVARIGGDEFIIIFNDLQDIATIHTLTQQILTEFNKPLLIKNKKLKTTLSLGTSIYPQDGENSSMLIKHADTAMYHAKELGRNNCQFYTNDMTQRTLERIKLEEDLSQSLQNNEMEVYYQLQFDSRDNSLVGMEALIRWNHPEKGLITPSIFIPICEETGFITKIDEWTMRQAMQQIKTWQEQGLPTGLLSLNLSISRLEKDDFIDSIQNILSEINLEKKYISFEVTESQVMLNIEQSIKKLTQLSNLGIDLAIDDFGTGYSSLAYLKRLPVNKLKIDHSFIDDIPHDTNDIEITKTIIAMAKNLNLGVIAEGVVTQEQCDLLLEYGCFQVQGYHFHKPAPANNVAKSLRALLQ